MSFSVEQAFREEWPRAVSILARVLGDLALAEDAVQDAFATALERWPRDGPPRSPGAWIVATARNSAIDRLRRERTFRQKAELLARLETNVSDDVEADVSAIPDDRLAARADLLRRLGRRDEAAASYQAALELTGNGAERRFLERRLRELTSPTES